MKRVLLIVLLVVSVLSISSCAEEVIEPSASRSDAAGITIEDENW